MSDNMVTFLTHQGLELRGTLHRLTRNKVVFETYGPEPVLRMSEILTDFTLRHVDQTVYSGKAVISNLLQTGSCTVCEALLDDSAVDGFSLLPNTNPARAKTIFAEFLEHWGKSYRVLPEFKQVMGDFQNFLTDLRIWLDQIELGFRSSPSGDRAELERNVLKELAEPVTNAIDTFVERFEAIVANVEDELQPVHRIYLQRQLHPLLLCSPFAYRAVYKPLGYAGDYELVDMMMRPPYEGSTLFAKAINVWLLAQAPARAHRNRVDYLAQKLLEEAARSRSRGRVGRVYNLGCGPAAEIQRFLRDQPVSNHMQFTLLDFNEETLDHARVTLEGLKRTHGRSTPIQLLKRSVHQLLKEAGKPAHRTPENQYDFIYCAGLFDYLSDAVCRRLMDTFYDMLAPGGLLVATNVSNALNQSRPFRYSMEYILEWFLIYRNGPQLGTLIPERAPQDGRRLIAEAAGVNVFVEVRKPNDA